MPTENWHWRDIVPAERLTTPRLSFPAGVETKVDDVFKVTGVYAIVQECNCLTVKAHGLSQAIAGRYPWADPRGKETWPWGKTEQCRVSFKSWKNPPELNPMSSYSTVYEILEQEEWNGFPATKTPRPNAKNGLKNAWKSWGPYRLPKFSLFLWNRMWFTRRQLELLRTFHSLFCWSNSLTCNKKLVFFSFFYEMCVIIKNLSCV